MAETAGASPTVVVVGAGPAGVRAAGVLVKAGLRPVVIDEAPRAGGQVYRQPPQPIQGQFRALYGFEAGKAQRLHAAFDGLRQRVDHRGGTLVWGAEDERLLLSGPGGLTEQPYQHVILATGAMDRVIPVPGWTSSGVYSLGGAQVSLKSQGCVIGQRTVLVGGGPLLYLVAWQYARAGARPAAVLDTSPAAAKRRALPKLAARPLTLAKGVYFAAWLRLHGIRVVEGATALAIEPGTNGFTVRYRSGRGTDVVEGDAVAIGYGLRPETQLAELLGCALRFDSGARAWVPVADRDGRTSVPGVYVAGDGAGIRGADAAETSGELAARALLEDLGMDAGRYRQRALRRHMARMERFRQGLEQAFPWPQEAFADMPDETIVCRCEAVTAGELRHATDRWGVTEVNRLKAVTRCGMGRCQGRLCGAVAAEVLAERAGVGVEEAGRLRCQMPLKPLPIGV